MTETDIKRYVGIVARRAPNLAQKHYSLLQGYFAHNVQLEGSSLQRYAYHLRTFLGYLEEYHVDLPEITVTVLNEFYVHRLKDCNRRHVNHQLIVVYAFLKFLNYNEMLPNAIYRQLEFQRSRFPRSRGTAPKELLTEEEFKLILQTCEDHRAKMIVWILWHYALRPKEVVSLKDEDVDLQLQHVVIRESKHHRTRVIPIPKSHLGEWRLWFGRKVLLFPVSSYVIPRKIKGPEGSLSVQLIGQMVKQAASILNKRVYPYMFRRTAATRADANGVPISTISHILGHSSIATTSIYILQMQQKVRRDWLSYKDDESGG